MCTISRFVRMAAFWPRHAGASTSTSTFCDALFDSRQIELQLDDHRYSAQAPLFVLDAAVGAARFYHTESR